MKGLILCAGKGTRLKPFSYSQPKTLLPVANKPVLYYGIEKLEAAGICEIGIVIHPLQEAAIRQSIGNGEAFGVSIFYIYQKHADGIAAAVSCAEAFIGSSPFVLLLGDNLVQEPVEPLIQAIMDSNNAACLYLAQVQDATQFGVAEIDQGRIIRLEEKPLKPRSNLAIVGVYAFHSGIFAAIKQLSPSARGEYEITDAIQSLIDQGHEVSCLVTQNRYSDVGNAQRWLEANRWVLEELSGSKNVISEDAIINNCEIIPPVIIGNDSRMENCIVGPYVSVLTGARLHNCRIEDSILLKNVTICDVSKPIQGSIFGNQTLLQDSAMGETVQIIAGDNTLIRGGGG